MSAEPEPDLTLEIAYLLLLDVVGYSMLLVNEQIELLQKLNRIVRSTECFRAAETSGKLIRLPTGDGMALIFFRSPEEPVRCALEISDSLKGHPDIKVRMGVHSGPVNQVTDVNDRINIAGAGINVAQRVLDCGDAGHILLSKHLADDLAHYRHWQPYLHDLGEYEVKHGMRLTLVNLHKDGLGNPALPEKLRRGRKWKRASTSSVRPINAPHWPKFALVTAFVLSVVALVSSFAIFFHRSAPPAANPSGLAAIAVPDKSIAVLPFENLSDDKQNAYFADGVQDEILTNLAKVADLKVISRTSVMQYKNRAQRNLREIGSALGVAHILEGTVQKAAGRVRVNAQLIDARTDAHIWGERYDRDLADVFAIENELAEQIVSQLKSRLSPREKAAIEEKPTTDLAAYDLYMRAKNLLASANLNELGKNNLLKAIELLNQAVKRDPAFFLAYYQLAHAHDQMYLQGFDHTPARLALADAAIQSIMRLRPDSGEAHLAVAKHLYWGYLDYDRARQELEAARRALPNDPMPFLLIGYIERRQGHWDESTRDMEHAFELDPRNLSGMTSGVRSVEILVQMSLSFENLRRYSDMAATLDRALKLAPEDAALRTQRARVELDWRADTKPLHSTVQTIISADPSATPLVADQWIFLALCERDSESAARALSAMSADACRIEGGMPFPRAWCEGLVARARGDADEARTAFTKARADVEKIVRDQPDYPQALSVIGLIDAALGNKDDAIREGRRAVELLPVSKDSIDGALLAQYLAVIYTWCGKKDLALKQLEVVTKLPGYLSYGQLRLHPFWDLLRGDPRFDKIVASLAPK